MSNTLNYLNASSSLTLREGIQELRAAEGAEGDAAAHVAEDLLDAIEAHDAIHVLFACPTNLAGEISAHVWTVFGTTMSVREMHSVNRHRDHKAVLRQIGHGNLIMRWLKALPSILGTVYRSRKMSNLWPADEFQKYLDRPLDKIRSEFNITLPALKSSGGGSSGAALRHIRVST